MNALKLGLLLIFFGLVTIFLGTFLSAHQTDFAGLIMIGPIPIVFGTSPLITIASMVIGLLLMIAFFISAAALFSVYYVYWKISPTKNYSKKINNEKC